MPFHDFLVEDTLIHGSAPISSSSAAVMSGLVSIANLGPRTATNTAAAFFGGIIDTCVVIRTELHYVVPSYNNMWPAALLAVRFLLQFSDF